jgi:DNA-directed RNA polymerase specialized sigma subunit
MIRKKKKKVNYIDNKKLFDALVEFKQQLKEAKEQNKEPPRVTPYIGECIMKISVGLSNRPNFINYSYKDEMISDGIENCLLYAIRNFDPEKSKNPFAYFTQIIYFAFLRRLQKEKKIQYTKAKYQDEMSVSSELPHNSKKDDWDRDQLDIFIEDFERKCREKKKIKNKNTTPIDELIIDS